MKMEKKAPKWPENYESPVADVLKVMQFRKKLSPLERDQYSRLRELASKCKKKHGSIDKLLEVCEKEVLELRGEKD